MAAPMILRYGVSSRAKLTSSARHGSQMAVPDYCEWYKVMYGKTEQASAVLSYRDLVRESGESLILVRRKKIGTHNIRHLWIVAAVAMSGYIFGAGVATLFTGHNRRTPEAAGTKEDTTDEHLERQELRKKLGRLEE
uniref:Uncharacterized protein n=1 Tax=Oryza punctata TaxID=4537 RepID=A0A0E0LG85_ORYPU